MIWNPTRDDCLRELEAVQERAERAEQGSQAVWAHRWKRLCKRLRTRLRHQRDQLEWFARIHANDRHTLNKQVDEILQLRRERDAWKRKAEQHQAATQHLQGQIRTEREQKEALRCQQAALCEVLQTMPDELLQVAQALRREVDRLIWEWETPATGGKEVRDL